MTESPTPRIELVGDWTSPHILIRLMDVIDSPWELTREGLTHQETGETCRVEMRPHDSALVDRFPAGESPVRPSLDAETLAGIGTHRSVLTVQAVGELSGWDAARAVLRCGSGLIDAGGIAVRCELSGLAHSAEQWQALERIAQGAEDDATPALLGEALYRAFVMPFQLCAEGVRTSGMAVLEAPDAIIVGPDVAERHAVDAMEDLCLRMLTRQPPESGKVIRVAPNRPGFRIEHGPDPNDPVTEEHNPFGLWRMIPAP